MVLLLIDMDSTWKGGPMAREKEWSRCYMSRLWRRAQNCSY